MSTIFRAGELRKAFESATPPAADEIAEYRIAAAMGKVFLARARSGAATLIVPMEAAVDVVGRRGGGFSLTMANQIAFDYSSRQWVQPGATLECTDTRFLDAFLVLVADIATRLNSTPEPPTWGVLLLWVEEWQTLLGERPTLSAEQQLGLWGELWVLSRAIDLEAVIGGWRGPEGEAVDFLLDGVGLEVKTSRRPHIHHMSRRQAGRPVGDHESYLLSLWVGVDPVRGISVVKLADDLMAQAVDAADILKRLIHLGYAPTDRQEYETRLILLEPPCLLRMDDVPTVRVADSGISNLRYVVTLEVDKSISAAAAEAVWHRLRCRTDFSSPELR